MKTVISRPDPYFGPLFWATAIGGLLPLALSGSGLYAPLAIVIIGGLISSTFLSRVVTPVTYLLLAPRDVA